MVQSTVQLQSNMKMQYEDRHYQITKATVIYAVYFLLYQKRCLPKPCICLANVSFPDAGHVLNKYNELNTDFET